MKADGLSGADQCKPYTITNTSLMYFKQQATDISASNFVDLSGASFNPSATITIDPKLPIITSAIAGNPHLFV